MNATVEQHKLIASDPMSCVEILLIRIKLLPVEIIGIQSGKVFLLS